MNTTILERAAIIKLHNDGFSNWQILKKLKISSKSRDKVRHTIDRYNETGSLENRRHKSHKKNKRTSLMLKSLKQKLRRNP